MSNMDNATQPLDADNLLSLAGKITRIKVSVDDISVDEYAIYKAFKCLGEIGHVVETRNSFSVSFVRSDPMHDLTDQIKPVDAEPSHDPPDRHSPLHILNALNDGCLLMVFKQLHVRDLCAAANTCTRLNGIGRVVFQSRYKNRPFAYNDLDPARRRESLNLFESCLRTFNPTQIILRGSCSSADVVLRLIAEYGADDLQQLLCQTDRFTKLRAETVAAIQPLLPRLKLLEIRASDIIDEDADVEWQVEEMCIGASTRGTLPRIKTPKLANLTLRCEHDAASTHDFIAANPQLKELQLAYYHLTVGQLAAMAGNVPALQSLLLYKCYIDGTADARSLKFKCLAKCTIIGCSGDRAFLHALDGRAIEQLSVCFNSSVNIDAIRRMSNIIELNIGTDRGWQGINEEQLMQLSQALKLRKLIVVRTSVPLGCLTRMLEQQDALREFHAVMDSSTLIRISFNECKAMSALIGHRPDLRVTILAFKGSIKVPGDALERYSDWLNVQDRDIFSNIGCFNDFDQTTDDNYDKHGLGDDTEDDDYTDDDD